MLLNLHRVTYNSWQSSQNVPNQPSRYFSSCCTWTTFGYLYPKTSKFADNVSLFNSHHNKEVAEATMNWSYNEALVYEHRCASPAASGRGLREGPPSTSEPSSQTIARRIVPSPTQTTKLALCTTITLERAHARQHLLRANVFRVSFF